MKSKQICLELTDTDRGMLRTLRLVMDVKANSKVIRTLIKEAYTSENPAPNAVTRTDGSGKPTTLVLSDWDIGRVDYLQTQLGCSTRTATLRQLIWDAFLFLTYEATYGKTNRKAA
ncbi:hypothetical protein FRD01_13665 [Microvenator marinus]|uniref:Uncharacterized protein n=1 Tax=Microvenator marinus TaxID=2600177 RepID=A0A5B8XTP1_9DELT|nr:hypothetical protein [Microvenator marinus]QED28258.1 hypothetical protein FRD01_13665 [Microvenator marinus]